MSRHLAREIAFKTLFQLDFGSNEVEPAFSRLLEENGLSGDHAVFARTLVEGTLQNQEAIDTVLTRYLVNWELSRLAPVDRNVLRLATYEIIYREDIPNAVAINEALEISKIFHDEEAAKFLNGVLDKLARNLENSGEVN